jgi:hypothetical protein
MSDSRASENQQDQSDYTDTFRDNKSTFSRISRQSKTANQIKITGLDNEDLHDEGMKFVQDEFNRQDKEIQQFDKPAKTIKFVESLVTGQFKAVNKDFDPNIEMTDISLMDCDGSGIVTTQEKNDYEMKLQQDIWVNRINKVYSMSLGLLGGMGVMHIIFLSAHPDNDNFHKVYAETANLICIVTLVLTNLTLIFGMSLTLIYKAISDKKQRNLESDRLVYKDHLVLGLVT